jgi:hypothetical protein
VMVVILTTLMTPPTLKWSMAAGRSGSSRRHETRSVRRIVVPCRSGSVELPPR